MAWIIVIPALLLIWGAADYTYGKQYFKKQAIKRHYPEKTGFIELITRGPDLFERMFDDIKLAESSIHILFYIVRNDRISQEFIELLADKAEQGVKVRLLLDWVGSKKADRILIEAARARGVDIYFCNKPRLPFLFFTAQQRNHRKITVIDGRIGYMGGYNIGKEYIDQDPVLTPWRDYHLRLTGEGVRDLQHEFLVDWKRCGNSKIEANGQLFPENEPGRMLHQFFPTEGSGLEEEVCRLLENAETSVIIGSPYFIPSQPVQNAILAAIERGVRVRILVPKKSDHFLVQEASYRYLRDILSAGGEVYQFTDGFFHAKAFMIDSRICDIGTANFDKRSLFLNYEINCYIYDAEFIGNALAVIEADIASSHRLSLKELEGVGFCTRAKEMLSRLVEPFL